MSKKTLNFSNSVMEQIDNQKVHMRPSWYFFIGSGSLIIALTSTFIFSVYLISLVSFSLRFHGPMGQVRFEQLISNFPFWAAILAVLATTLGVYLLKRFDFSYRKNFALIMIGFILSVLLAGIIIDIFGISSRSCWGRQNLPKRYLINSDTIRR